MTESYNTTSESNNADSLNDSDEYILSNKEISELRKIEEKTKLRMERDKYINDNINFEDFLNNNSNSSRKLLNFQESNNINNNNKLSIMTPDSSGVLEYNEIDINRERIFTNLIPYIYYKGEPLIIISNNELKYYIFLFVFISVIAGIIYSFLREHSMTMKVLLIILYTSSSILYFILIVINPGIPKKVEFCDLKDNTNYVQCSGCNCIYDIYSKTVHCEACGICIEKYDHHCNFSTKCIGKKNKEIFNAFLGSVVLFIFCLILAIFM